jgi:hypothetical protein
MGGKGRPESKKEGKDMQQHQMTGKFTMDHRCLKLYELEAIKKWQVAAIDCPMRGAPPTVTPFCKVGGWRRGGYGPCEYESCFARFAKNMAG